MNTHDSIAEAAAGARKGNWLDELMADASKTMVIGVGAEDHKVCGLNMKRGRCPICGEEIERVKDDIYFPYCGYEHKRRVQRIEEEKMRAEVAAEEAQAQRRYERQLLMNQQRRQRLREMSRREILEKRIEDAQANWEASVKKAAEAPKSSKEKYRANARARDWYKVLLDAKRQLKELEAHENVESAIQGLEQDGIAQDAGAGHEQSGDCGFAGCELHDDIPSDRGRAEGDAENLQPRA